MVPGGPNAFRRASRRVSAFVVPKASALARRCHGFTWQSFPAGIGTGTAYILLFNLKPHPAFLTPIEIGLFILNVIIFSTSLLFLLAQAVVFPKRSWSLLVNPATNTFVPTVALNFATVIVGIINYANPTPDEMFILFFIYIAVAFVVSITVIMFWFSTPRDPKTFTPAWAFPIFPLLLTGVVAFNTLRVIPLTDPRALTVFLVGMMFFGGGCFMSLLYLAVFLLRIMMTGFMDGHQANGAFVAGGPPGFTALVLLNITKQAKTILVTQGLISQIAGEVWEAGAIFLAIMLVGFSGLLFLMAVLPYWFKLHKHLNEILGCWAATFPNLGLILSLKFLGDTFNSSFMAALSTVLTFVVLAAYLVIVTLTGIAVFKGLVLNSTDKDVYAESIGVDVKTLGPPDEEKGHGHGH